MGAMAAVDAQQFWLSAKVPNDQFLLYAFAGEPDIPAAAGEILRHAQRCEPLRLRIVDDTPWRYPSWVPATIGSDDVVVHAGGDLQQCLDAVVGLDQLDATRLPWRVHIFAPNVVVVQMSHALGDGSRSAALAAALLGRRAPISPVATPRPGSLPWRALVAARAHRGSPPPSPPRPALSINARPASTPTLRTLVLDSDRLTPTVTIGALVAISEALGGYLRARGEDTNSLGAEVPMAGPDTGAVAAANNNFANVSVGLYPELARPGRAERISADLDDQRRRRRHRAAVTSADAFAATPAWLLRWGVGKFDAGARGGMVSGNTVSGNTVVSSVHRGPADLSFGGCPVRFTAGFPALSPMQSLTHGVHGIGGTVAVSVHADPVNVDVDDYLARLAHALGCQP
jgi:hypothetical protein